MNCRKESDKTSTSTEEMTPSLGRPKFTWIKKLKSSQQTPELIDSTNSCRHQASKTNINCDTEDE